MSIKDKEVIDVRPENETPKEETKVEDAEYKIPNMFFTVSSIGKGGRPFHYIIKAESALQALMYVQDVKKTPVMGVHVTEYQVYCDAREYYDGLEETSEIIT